MKAKGLDRKYANVICVEDEEQERRIYAMSNDYDDADEVGDQEAEDPNLNATEGANAKTSRARQTRKPRNAPKSANAPAGPVSDQEADDGG